MVNARLSSLLLLLSLLAHAGALDLSSVAAPETPLQTQRLSLLKLQMEALLVGSYQANGMRNPVWDERVLSLARYTVNAFTRQKQQMSEEEASRTFQEMTAPGACDDPLPAWCRAILFQQPREMEAYQLRRTALEAMDRCDLRQPPGKRYPRILKILLISKMMAFHSRQQGDEKARRPLWLTQELAQSVKESLKRNECSQFPGLWLRTLRDCDFNHQAFSEPVVAAVDEAVKADHIPPWLKDGLRGAIRIPNAWGYRGSGWADSVTKEGWAGFERSLKEADSFLTAAWTANPKEVLVPAFGITVAGAGHSASSMETWLVRAMGACLDHDLAPDSYLAFCRPRWGKTFADMLAFGTAMDATGRYDTDVPWYLIRSIQEASQEAAQLGGADELRATLNRPGVLARIDACLGAYQKSSPAEEHYFTTHKAVILWLAGKRQEASDCLDRVPPERINREFDRWYSLSIDEVKAFKYRSQQTSLVP